MSWQFSDIWSLNKILNDIRWWWLGHSCFLWLFVISEKIIDECYDGYIVYRNVSFKKKNKTKVCQSTCPTTTCFSKNPPSRIRTNSSRVAKSAWEKSSGGGVKHLLEMIPHPICGKFVEMIPNLWEIWNLPGENWWLVFFYIKYLRCVG